MTAPGFRFLTKEELEKLSTQEHIEYVKEVIQHVRQQAADRQKTIDARNKRVERIKNDKR